PVARWLKFVDKPLLTAGALTFDYTEPKTEAESEYFLTTRTGFSFKEMVEFIMTYFDRFNWRKAFLMYDKEDMREVSGNYTCKFFMETVAQYLKENKWPFGNFDLKTNNVNASVKETLAKELGLKYSGLLIVHGHKIYFLKF
ncbi:Atrial natriuretic peptide receptor 3, partial [Orchesella cincta]